MWPSRTSRSFGISRFFWLGALVALCAFAVSGRADAAVYQWRSSVCSGHLGPFENSVSAAVQDAVTYVQANQQTCIGNTVATCDLGNTPPSGPCTVTLGTSPSPNPFPSYSGGTINWTNSVTPTPNSSFISFSISDTAVTDNIPSCGTAGQQAFIGGGSAPGLTCVGGCLYSTPNPGLEIYASGAPHPTIYDATSTGTNCGSSDAGQSASQGTFQDCDSSGTICHSGTNCGTFNGDQVCVNTVPPGSCVQYASGGVACTAGAAAAPTAPGGGAATPTGKVVDAGTGGTQTVNYYSSSVVSASTTTVTTTTPVQPQAEGTQGLGSGGGGGGTVTVAGTVSTRNADAQADGDCSANASNCNGGVPQYDWSGDCASFEACAEGFYTSVSGAPILAGAAAITTSWPAGSCDIGSVDFATFNKTLNYGTTACQVWDNYISAPLSAISLAVWAVMGVIIVLTA